MYLALAFLLAAYGIVSVFNPLLLWKLTHRFSTKGGEPTGLYLVFARLRGMVFLAFALLMVVGRMD